MVFGKQFSNIFLGCFSGTTVNQNLLIEIVLSGDILTTLAWFVHIPHVTITILVGMIEITTAIVVTEPSIVSLTITYTKVNPYLSNNRFPHKSQCHTTFLVELLKAKKGSMKTIMLILIAFLGWFLQGL